MKKLSPRRARLAREARNAQLIAYVILAIIFASLVRLTAPTRDEYNRHMMCDVYGHQEYCK